MSQEIPEYARPTTIHGNDPKLTREAILALDREAAAASDRTKYSTPELVAPLEVSESASIRGIGINSEFNKGIQHGPWKASDEEVAYGVENGYTPDEIHHMVSAMKTGQAAAVNAYPFGNGTESHEIKKQAQEDYDDIIRKVGNRVREQIESEESDAA